MMPVPKSAPALKASVIAILEHYHLPIAAGVYLKLQMRNYLDLIIELSHPRLARVVHSSSIYGDVVYDPEVLCFIRADGSWIPIEYCSPLTGGQQLCTLNEDATAIATIAVALQYDVADFCHIWAKNLRDQPWRSAATVAESAVPDSSGAE